MLLLMSHELCFQSKIKHSWPINFTWKKLSSSLSYILRKFNKCVTRITGLNNNISSTMSTLHLVPEKEIQSTMRCESCRCLNLHANSEMEKFLHYAKIVNGGKAQCS